MDESARVSWDGQEEGTGAGRWGGRGRGLLYRVVVRFWDGQRLLTEVVFCCFFLHPTLEGVKMEDSWNHAHF